MCEDKRMFQFNPSNRIFRTSNHIFIVLLLASTLHITGTVITLPGLHRPAMFTIDQNQIYITDKEKIHIFSITDYQPVTSFGNKGEGPQSFLFQTGIEINTQTTQIIVESQGKLSFFTKTGEYIKELRLPSRARKLRPLANGFVGTISKVTAQSRYHSLDFFNENLEKQGPLARLFPQPEGKKIQFLGTTWNYITHQNQVFVTAKKDFMVEVYDQRGNQLFTITRDYERIPIDGSFKDHFFTWVKKNRPMELYERMKTMFEFSDSMPAIFDIIIDQNTLYILTYKRNAEKNEVFLYTTTGKFIKAMVIPLYKDHPIDPLPYTIHDGKIYQLIDNAGTEEWELWVTPIQ